MKKEKIIKEDGRYLIFYAFDEELLEKKTTADLNKETEAQSNQDSPAKNDD